ncbi:hypothetical protein LXA43DRAFT_1097865 [Ganoderma leucocontextum]|nr:hypothetical protein LXA43DRAFT_1097865 [Ganoderma leucocontextum]
MAEPDRARVRFIVSTSGLSKRPPRRCSPSFVFFLERGVRLRARVTSTLAEFAEYFRRFRFAHFNSEDVDAHCAEFVGQPEAVAHNKPSAKL